MPLCCPASRSFVSLGTQVRGARQASEGALRALPMATCDPHCKSETMASRAVTAKTALCSCHNAVLIIFDINKLCVQRILICKTLNKLNCLRMISLGIAQADINSFSNNLHVIFLHATCCNCGCTKTDTAGNES